MRVGGAAWDFSRAIPSLFWAAESRSRRPRLSLYCRHQQPDPHDIQDAREIVGEDVQRHLAGDVWQPLHQEVGCAHASLDRAEGVLNRLSPRPHGIGICVEPSLDFLDDMFMLPPGDPLFIEQARQAAVDQ